MSDLDNPASGIYAHTPPKGGGDWHDLVTHLRAVAERASAFGAKFGGSAAGMLLGLTHDLAKASCKGTGQPRSSTSARRMCRIKR